MNEAGMSLVMQMLPLLSLDKNDALLYAYINIV